MNIRMGTALFACAGLTVLFAAEPARKSGIDKNHFDTAVRPQDDMFRWVNGKWLAEAEIPADRSSDGAFYELRDLSEKRVRAIIEDAAKHAGDADSRKIADLYASFMDEKRANELGMAPIEPDLKAIAAIEEKAGLIRQVAALQRGGMPGLFVAFVSPDSKESDKTITYLSQGGLGLPNESYYREPRFEPIRKAYVAHIGRMLALVKFAEPGDAAKRIMAIETAIAKGHWDNVRSRDADKTYNKMSHSQLKELAADIDWDTWFHGVGAKDIPEAVVRQPSFFSTLAKTLGQFPLDDWKAYLTWRVVASQAPLLSEPFVKERFDFAGKTLMGTPEMQPRWKRGVALVEGALGEAVGKLYVARHFKPEAKERMKALVNNLIEAYRVDIQALDWMSEETKKRALIKLDKFTPKIGYPDKWRDYSKLEVRGNDLVGNARREAQFDWDYTWSKLGKPVDRGEWGMTPQTVNAYYNPTKNEIVFPAAILQPPFF
ncbi:MAG TPA: M13-type metalloendopeptidase, partial [Urbifossiella sp.]|nr:M13-type metalloendopeptidase [Urbifossiella sp.]